MEPLKRDERPFLVLDVQRLPFRDQVWDFTFCSHVLEHVEQPGEACRELMRVSRQGYIEVPTRLSDVMLNFTRLSGHHRWHGLVLGQTLVLTEWSDKERCSVGTDYFFHCLHSKYDNPFQTMFEQNWSVFYAMLHWREKFDFLVIDRYGRIVDRSPER
jgi:ubiquinone/menaquinone biosynthesis C-methylase UbiE